MIFTMDMTAEEIEIVSRLLIAHISSTTDALRSRAVVHVPTAHIERMWTDIRVAAVLAGRLPSHTARTETA
jgi:hypothetical protein